MDREASIQNLVVDSLHTLPRPCPESQPPGYSSLLSGPPMMKDFLDGENGVVGRARRSVGGSAAPSSVNGFVECVSTQAWGGPCLTILLPSLLDRHPGVVHATAPLLVQALLAPAADATLREGVLHRGGPGGGTEPRHRRPLAEGPRAPSSGPIADVRAPRPQAATARRGRRSSPPSSTRFAPSRASRKAAFSSSGTPLQPDDRRLRRGRNRAWDPGLGPGRPHFA